MKNDPVIQEEHARRMEYAKKELIKNGVQTIEEDGKTLYFIHNGERISFWPYTGWFSGKGIHSGRGIKVLMTALRHTSQKLLEERGKRYFYRANDQSFGENGTLIRTSEYNFGWLIDGQLYMVEKHPRKDHIIRVSGVFITLNKRKKDQDGPRVYDSLNLTKKVAKICLTFAYSD